MVLCFLSLHYRKLVKINKGIVLIMCYVVILDS
jgi:hypothetical protein